MPANGRPPDRMKVDQCPTCSILLSLNTRKKRKSRTLMHSMFFCFISCQFAVQTKSTLTYDARAIDSLMVVKYVNLARDETKASRSVSISNRAAILKP